jgi:hypothetical protein
MSPRPKSSIQLRAETVEAMCCDPRLNPGAVRIGSLLVLRYVNGEVFRVRGDLEAWPGLPRLSADAGMSGETVSSALRQLCACGYLELLSRGVGRGVNSRYRIVPHKPPRAEKSKPWIGVFPGGKTPEEFEVFECDY